jgi:predicted DCC family thiol-disulfide oxidoreductase YuxK
LTTITPPDSAVHLVVLDGDCGFCRTTGEWLKRRDRFQRLTITTFRQYSTDRAIDDHSVALVSGEKTIRGSEAVILILDLLPFPYPVLGKALGLLPRFLRESGYRFVARHRRLFFKNNSPAC